MILLPKEALQFPRIGDYCGVWLAESEFFRRTVDAIAKMDLVGHMQEAVKDDPLASPSNKAGVSVGSTERRNIGVVNLSGTLMKHVSSMSEGTSTVMARRAIRTLADDPNVDGIMLKVDSHGGTAAGTGELGDDLRKASASKPVHAFIDDHGFSAGYWTPSQAQRVSINEYGFSGSIGTYGVVVDSKEYHEQKGLKVHVVTTGKHKGVGVPGTEVTSEHLDYLRTRIESINEKFLNAVSSARKIEMTTLQEIADGRVFNAKESVEHKLVDSISTFEEALEHLASKTRGKVQAAVPTTVISNEEENMEPATLEQIKGACKNAPSDFILSQLEKGHTLDQVKDAWIEQLQSGTSARRTVPADVVSDLGTTTATTVGDTATEEVDEEVQQLMSQGVDRRAAVRRVFAANPELHQRYLKEHNKNKSPFVQMAIDSKFVK